MYNIIPYPNNSNNRSLNGAHNSSHNSTLKIRSSDVDDRHAKLRAQNTARATGENRTRLINQVVIPIKSNIEHRVLKERILADRVFIGHRLPEEPKPSKSLSIAFIASLLISCTVLYIAALEARVSNLEHQLHTSFQE